MRNLFSSVALAALCATPAYAGEEVLKAEAPSWVEPADFEAAMDEGEQVVLYDRQVRLEDGTVTRYTDVAYDVRNEQALSNYSTLQFGWMPDKGDLTIHRLEIHRDGEVIDLVEQGVEPEILRRERKLEQRMVDGMLTAVLRVPGLAVGDILRFSTSTTRRDQALDGEVQVAEGAIAEPTRLGFGRLRLSWPVEENLEWQTMGQIDIAEPADSDGYRVIEVDLPIAKPAEMPEDAPDRFNVPPAVQVSSFDGWGDVARTMAPHFSTAGAIDEGGSLAREVARIEAATDVPLERAALALRTVQDEITYLLDGMNGGNYLPQSPELTWEVKYGDCKAKSLLLLAMLREMGIEADAMLVHTSNGDAVSVFQPQPGAFDHVVVRAIIDGTDYWLDGTSAGSRLETLYEVPSFHYALPLASEADQLVKVEQRWPRVADRTMRLSYDFGAGVDLPVLVDIEVETRGIMAARMRAPASEQVKERVIGSATQYLKDLVDAFIYDADYDYDEETGIGRLIAKGMAFDSFEFDRETASMNMRSATTNWEFAPDRARAAWRDIPYQVGGPYTTRTHVTYILPEDSSETSVSGVMELDQITAGVRFKRDIEHVDDRVVVSDFTSYVPSEIAPSEIPAQKSAMRRLASGDPVLRLRNARRVWEFDDEEVAEHIQPHIEAVTRLADTIDDATPIIFLRGLLKTMGRDYAAGLVDIDAAIAEEATVERLNMRTDFLTELGRIEEARETAQEAFDLTGDIVTASKLAQTMVESGEAKQALDLLDQLGLAGDEAHQVAMLWGEYAGDADRVEEAWNRLENALADRPGDSSILNSQCWLAATWDPMREGALDICDRAVRAGGYGPAMLDSRALLYHRLGRNEEALDDLNAALRKEPGMAASLFLRGVIRLDEGDKAGRTDILHAERIQPSVKRQYSRYGIDPKS